MNSLVKMKISRIRLKVINLSVEKSESNEETAPVEPMPHSKPTTE